MNQNFGLIGKKLGNMQVFDEDQYSHQVAYKPGRYTITRKDLGTRYAVVALRMLVDPNKPEDLAAVHLERSLNRHSSTPSELVTGLERP